MSLLEIQKRFPGFPSVSANQLGVAEIHIGSGYRDTEIDKKVGDSVFSLISASTFPELSELKHVELKLLDGKLIEVTIYYTNLIKWKSADEFAQKTSEALKLDGEWRKIGEDSEYSETRSLSCGDVVNGFSVRAGFRIAPSERTILGASKFPYVTLENFMHGEMEIYKRNREREENANREEEERKKVFKP